MARFIVLDSGPLGVFCNPVPSPVAKRARDWMANRIRAGDKLVLPEIADYEVRRELIRAKRSRSLSRLDELGRDLKFEPLRTNTFRLAAELWATTRNSGRPTAHPAALDGDVILAAQALLLMAAEGETTVLTMNPAHLDSLVPVVVWNEVI